MFWLFEKTVKIMDLPVAQSFRASPLFFLHVVIRLHALATQSHHRIIVLGVNRFISSPMPQRSTSNSCLRRIISTAIDPSMFWLFEKFHCFSDFGKFSDFFEEPVLKNDLLVIRAVDVRGPLRCRRQYAVHRSDPEPAILENGLLFSSSKKKIEQKNRPEKDFPRNLEF